MYGCTLIGSSFSFGGGGGVAKNSVEKLFQATPISMELVLDTILRCVNEEGNSKLVVPFCVEEFKVVIF